MSNTLDNRIPPPVLALVIGLAMLGATFVSPAMPLLPMVRWGLTAAFLGIALIVGMLAFSAFLAAKTTIDPIRIDRASHLVTTGVYRVTRNPMYLALTSLLFALALWTSRPWLFVGPVVFVWFITRFQIIPEERAMAAKFGAAYHHYRAQVRRWL